MSPRSDDLTDVRVDNFVPFIFSSEAQQPESTAHRDDEGAEQFQFARNYVIVAEYNEAPTEPELLSEACTEPTRVLATQGSPSKDDDDDEVDSTPFPTGVHRNSGIQVAAFRH